MIFLDLTAEKMVSKINFAVYDEIPSERKRSFPFVSMHDPSIQIDSVAHRMILKRKQVHK